MRMNGGTTCLLYVRCDTDSQASAKALAIGGGTNKSKPDSQEPAAPRRSLSTIAKQQHARRMLMNGFRRGEVLGGLFEGEVKEVGKDQDSAKFETIAEPSADTKKERSKSKNKSDEGHKKEKSKKKERADEKVKVKKPKDESKSKSKKSSKSQHKKKSSSKSKNKSKDGAESKAIFNSEQTLPQTSSTDTQASRKRKSDDIDSTSKRKKHL